MDESPRKASPYPVFVALGIAVGELGVLFGVVPVAVGGVILFGGSAAAMARESGVARSAWRSLALIGAAIGLGSLAVWGLRAPAMTTDALRAAAATDGIAVRAAVVLGAAVVLVLAGVLGAAVESRRSSTRGVSRRW